MKTLELPQAVVKHHQNYSINHIQKKQEEVCVQEIAFHFSTEMNFEHQVVDSFHPPKYKQQNVEKLDNNEYHFAILFELQEKSFY